MIIQPQPDGVRAARRWSARSAGPVGVTATGALWALKEQQAGDAPQTWADVSIASELIGYRPTTSFQQGVTSFYDWWQSSKTL